jgi:hypothetical protein
MPIVQIIQEDSDDVRDKLLSQFLQSLGHSSRWLKIEYKGEIPKNDFVAPYKKVWQLAPITTSELKREMALMDSLLHVSEKTEFDIERISKTLEDISDK